MLLVALMSALAGACTVDGQNAGEESTEIADDLTIAKPDLVATKISYGNGAFGAVVANRGKSATSGTAPVGVKYLANVS